MYVLLIQCLFNARYFPNNNACPFCVCVHVYGRSFACVFVVFVVASIQQDAAGQIEQFAEQGSE